MSNLFFDLGMDGKQYDFAEVVPKVDMGKFFNILKGKQIPFILAQEYPMIMIHEDDKVEVINAFIESKRFDSPNLSLDWFSPADEINREAMFLGATIMKQTNTAPCSC